MMTGESYGWLREFIKKQHGTVAPEPWLEEELTLGPQVGRKKYGFPIERAETKKLPYDIGSRSGESGFGFFEDGKQRTLLMGHIRWGEYHIPVHYACVGAVILRRTNGQLTISQQVQDNPSVKQLVIFPAEYLVRADALDDLPSHFEFVNIAEVEQPSYYDLRRRAVREAKKARLACETDLIHRWAQSFEDSLGFLVIDGTTINFHNERDVERCVGVSKSFRTLYCSLSDYQKILAMGEGERSWTFTFQEEDADLRMGMRDRISWYLRIRDPVGHNPEFGLLRLEISPRHGEKAPELADLMSLWAISERYPVSFPDNRWHNLLYPIKRCEDYLRTVMPSIETIRHSMGRY